MSSSTWVSETLFHDGDAYFSALIAEIDSARSTVDLETYIFDQDSLGSRLTDHLANAAKRGVRVRLLLDGVGCSQWNHANLDSLRSLGISARFYHPLPWQRSGFHVVIRLRKWISGFWKLNRRNHRKTCVIDGSVAFLGGMNVSSRHLAWSDTSVRVEGLAVADFTVAFEAAWNHTKGIPRHASLVRLNFNSRQRKVAYRDFLKRLRGSRSRVWVANAYFIPDLALVRILRFMAWSGLDVRVLLPRKSDIPGIRWAIRAFYFILLSSGVRIFEFKPQILHSKTVLADDWAIVGSSNLNHRSLIHDLESDVVLTSRDSLLSLQVRFQRDFAQSEEITLLAWVRRSRWQKVLEKFALKVRNWI